MVIGCVKEIKKHEYRVGVTPDNVKSYLAAGHTVLVETGAGTGSGFTDAEYQSAGAQIASQPEDVWAKSDMMIKVKEPLSSEYRFFREDQIIYTYLHLAADESLTNAMLLAKVKGVAYETLIEQDGSTPLLKPMSEIAGRLSVQEGAKFLEKPFGGRGILLGGVPGAPKANVVILGAGSVGENACRVALGMGANVTILDINMKRLTYLDAIYGSKLQTLYSTDAAIEKAVQSADLVIGAVLIPGKKAPSLIKRSYLAGMRPGSVIVDVAVDQGGCCETTKATYHDDPVYTVDGVVHYCVGNMPGAVPRTGTIALTNYTLGYGLQIAAHGLEDACRKNPVLYSAINTYDGKMTCENVATGFGMDYTPAQEATLK